MIQFFLQQCFQVLHLVPFNCIIWNQVQLIRSKHNLLSIELNSKYTKEERKYIFLLCNRQSGEVEDRRKIFSHGSMEWVIAKMKLTPNSDREEAMPH